MAVISFHIDDPANRMTLKVMLEAEGHAVVTDEPDAQVFITDNAELALDRVPREPAVLILSAAEHLSEAIQAMRHGVYGYIFLPFQPGEAGLMVQRALGSTSEQGDSARTDNGPIRTLEDVEAEHILDTLRRCKNNQAKTARVLGIGRNTLWRKLKKIQTMQKLSQSPPTS